MSSSMIIIAFLAIGLLSVISAQSEVSPKEEPLEVTTQRVEEDETDEAIHERLLRIRCEANGASDALEVAKNAPTVFRTCWENHFNSSGGRKGALDAKQSHELEKFFKKYCSSISDLKKCYTDFDASMAPCTTDEERNKQNIAQNLTTAAFNFICENEGSTFIRFAETGGIECVDDIADTYNCSLIMRQSPRMVDSIVSMSQWPRLNTPQDCKTFSDLKTCYVTALEVCGDPTPSTIAGTFFDRIIQVSPCGVPLTDPVPKSKDE